MDEIWYSCLPCDRAAVNPFCTVGAINQVIHSDCLDLNTRVITIRREPSNVLLLAIAIEAYCGISGIRKWPCSQDSAPFFEAFWEGLRTNTIPAVPLFQERGVTALSSMKCTQVQKETFLPTIELCNSDHPSVLVVLCICSILTWHILYDSFSSLPGMGKDTLDNISLAEIQTG
eukprot:TRINITY_DN97076_c0_g1_i1.p1 TRINITY_DN97076_c0_g1~~TRINITY_DN97076_c0_g1_i1.p1  ORF type:complete len:174 (+),score=11.29 TRINITY_DN97076_c0_g1_i1:228-749(+)